MKRLSILAIISAIALNAFSQNDSIFKCNLYNEEYKVYMNINLYDSNITAPRQEIFGELPGYFGQDNDSRVWLITDVKISKNNVAKLSIVNDYGSEDLTATLTVDKDGNYILKQEDGSRIKIVENRKWVKIPTELKFKKR
ncbi:hypothetical protein [Prevotella sp. HCN-7019]|uniref:hypothetical protein n=1 Tax=Prevotella sp. HCN-7019 TaxID=3134668 RepID=UPI002602C390